MAGLLILATCLALSGQPSTAPSSPSAAELAALQEAMAADAKTRQKSPSHDSASLSSPAMGPAAPAANAGSSATGSPAGGWSSLMNPDLALIVDAAVAAFDREKPLQLGAHDPRQSGFTLQQVEMHLASSVDPYFRLEANIVFSQFGVEVEEAYAATTSLPFGLQVRAGQFLTRFGRINPTHPHSWKFVDQPLVNGKFFGGEGSRGIGGELSWLMPLPWYAELIGSANEATGDCCARSFFGATPLPIRHPRHLLYTTALKQFFALSRTWGLSWGLSGQFGPNASGRRARSEIYGSDLHVRYRPVASQRRTSLTLSGEVMHRRRQVPGHVLADTGGYGQIVWQINRRWELGARYEAVWGVAKSLPDPLDPEWGPYRQRSSGQITFYPSHFSRVRAQGQLSWADAQPAPGWGAILAAEFLIGAHGAHVY